MKRYVFAIGPALVLAACTAGCAPGEVEQELDEGADGDDAAIVGCLDLSGTYSLDGTGCNEVRLPRPAADAARWTSVASPNEIEVLQTSCSGVSLQYEAVDYDAFCVDYNAAHPDPDYNLCEYLLYDCSTYGDYCPTAAELAPYVVTVNRPFAVGASKEGTSSRSVTLGSAGLTVKDSRPFACDSSGCVPALTTTFALKRSASGKLSVTRTGGNPQSCQLPELATGGAPPPPAATVTQISASGTLVVGGTAAFSIDLPAGYTARLKTLSSKDMDLYIKLGSPATQANYDKRAISGSGNETLTYTTSQAGTLHIMVLGYQAGSFQLITEPG